MSHRSQAKPVSGMVRTYVRTLRPYIVILGTTVGSEVALAQDADTPNKGGSLEEVVVTGSRVGRSTFTTPVTSSTDTMHAWHALEYVTVGGEK